MRFYFRDRRRSSSNRDAGMKISRGSNAPAGNLRFLYAVTQLILKQTRISCRIVCIYTKKKIKFVILNILFFNENSNTIFDTIFLSDFINFIILLI